MTGQSSRPQVSAAQCTSPEVASAAASPPSSATGTHHCASAMAEVTRHPSHPSSAAAVAIVSDDKRKWPGVSS